MRRSDGNRSEHLEADKPEKNLTLPLYSLCECTRAIGLVLGQGAMAGAMVLSGRSGAGCVTAQFSAVNVSPRAPNGSTFALHSRFQQIKVGQQAFGTEVRGGTINRKKLILISMR